MRDPDDYILCHWSNQIPFGRGDGVCSNWTLLSGSCWGVLRKPTKTWKTNWQSWHLCIWLQQQHNQDTEVCFVPEWKHERQKRQMQVMGPSYSSSTSMSKETQTTLSCDRDKSCDMNSYAFNKMRMCNSRKYHTSPTEGIFCKTPPLWKFQLGFIHFSKSFGHREPAPQSPRKFQCLDLPWGSMEIFWNFTMGTTS